jgi:asparagine synthase (glutamine-hydrolysing)
VEGDRFAALDAAFDAALAPWQDGTEPTVVLFSGGVDSGLIAWGLRRSRRVTLFTVGLDGSDDLRQAEASAPELGLPWVGRSLSEEDLERALAELRSRAPAAEGPFLGIFVALTAAVDRAPTGRLVCGQGADELFLGYAHFRGLDAARAEDRACGDLRRLQDEDWPRTRALGERAGRKIGAPFLHPGFVAAARAIPVEERLPGELTKPLMRRWAEHRGVPARLAAKPKRAIQYGTGVERWLRRHDAEPR